MPPVSRTNHTDEPKPPDQRSISVTLNETPPREWAEDFEAVAAPPFTMFNRIYLRGDTVYAESGEPQRDIAELLRALDAYVERANGRWKERQRR